jgi:hypothetical protein
MEVYQKVKIQESTSTDQERSPQKVKEHYVHTFYRAFR